MNTNFNTCLHVHSFFIIFAIAMVQHVFHTLPSRSVSQFHVVFDGVLQQMPSCVLFLGCRLGFLASQPMVLSCVLPHQQQTQYVEAVISAEPGEELHGSSTIALHYIPDSHLLKTQPIYSMQDSIICIGNMLLYVTFSLLTCTLMLVKCDGTLLLGVKKVSEEKVSLVSPPGRLCSCSIACF